MHLNVTNTDKSFLEKIQGKLFITLRVFEQKNVTTVNLDGVTKTITNGVNKFTYITSSATASDLTPIVDVSQEKVMKNTMTIKFNVPNGSGNFLGHSDEWQWNMKFSQNVNITTGDKSYETTLKKPFIVGAKSSNHMCVSTSFTFTTEERLGFKYEKHGNNESKNVVGKILGKCSDSDVLDNIKEADKLLQKSVDKWEWCIKNIIGNDPNKNFDYQKVVVKAMETIVNNLKR